MEFVLIGGLAGVAHGSSRQTYDVDLCHSQEQGNLDRLAATLRSIGAHLRGAPRDVPFLLDGKTLQAGGGFTFETPLGPIAILAEPAGAAGYDELLAGAVTIAVAGERVAVASLEHLIAMKEAAGRPRDLVDAQEYRVIAEEITRAGRSGAGGPP